MPLGNPTIWDDWNGGLLMVEDITGNGDFEKSYWITNNHLVGGLEHFLFSHILGIIIPIDFHIFQRGSNHQPVMSLKQFGENLGIWWGCTKRAIFCPTRWFVWRYSPVPWRENRWNQWSSGNMHRSGTIYPWNPWVSQFCGCTSLSYVMDILKYECSIVISYCHICGFHNFHCYVWLWNPEVTVFWEEIIHGRQDQIDLHQWNTEIPFYLGECTTVLFTRYQGFWLVFMHNHALPDVVHPGLRIITDDP